MAVVYRQTVVDEALVLVEFASDRTPPVAYRLYEDGVLVDAFTSPDGRGQKLVAAAAGAQPYFEAVDRAAALPAPAWPARVELHWQGVDGADWYAVSEYVAGDWVERARLPAAGAVNLSWTTRRLADGAHAFRVVASDDFAAVGDPLALDATVVRIPDPPAVVATFDADLRQFTFAEAT